MLTMRMIGPERLQHPRGWPAHRTAAMPKEPFVREKFTKEHSAARKLAREYFERFPKDIYLTEVESWRHLPSQNVEFTMKRLREPKC